jgi:hypothetical protein
MGLLGTKKDQSAVPAEPPPSYATSNGQLQPASRPGFGFGAASNVARQFPTTFNVYASGMGFRSFHIGEHQDQPLYAIELHTWTRGPNIVLHNNASQDSPPLAEIKVSGFRANIDVTLPALLTPGSSPPPAERAVAATGLHQRWNFGVEVGGVGGGGQREQFEWRHSRSDEVKSLGGSGFKLVRPSRGEEVVMVITEPGSSMTKQLRLAFRASGATGELGERWAVMAVATALGVWETQRRRRQTAAAS